MDDLANNLINAEGLSVNTKVLYANRIKILKSLYTGNKDLEFVILNPKKTIKKIYDKYKAYQTIKNFIATILAVFKYNPIFKQQYPNLYDYYYAEYEKANEKVNEKYDDNRMSEKQEEQFFTFEELLKGIEKMEVGTQDHLLMSFYTLMPPLRLDLNEVKIFKREPKKTDIDKYNFIVLRQRGSLVLVLNNYKTSKQYGKQELVLPKPLVKIIRNYFKQDEKINQDYLFLNCNDEPYTDSGFSLYISRVLKDILGKHSTLNMIRHAYINFIANHNLTTGEKKTIAKQMCHSTDMQDQYRLMKPNNAQTESNENKIIVADSGSDCVVA